jgi:hypothetical protein
VWLPVLRMSGLAQEDRLHLKILEVADLVAIQHQD